MSIPSKYKEVLERFLGLTDFSNGGIVLDLDGTALLEDRGKIFISGSVERAVKELVAIGRPVILNTLRFPLSVIRTVGREWREISGGRIPVVLLNGGMIGFIDLVGDDLSFEETESFPLYGNEIDSLVFGIRQLVDNGITQIILFYYPRDWRKGEIIWTPDRKNIDHLRRKYVSASEVCSTGINELHVMMNRAEPCMSLVLIDKPEDTLMSYQHSRPNSFFNRVKVDKAFGAVRIASHLGISLGDSIGAGDTEMDSFLSKVGLSVTVGDRQLPFRGLRGSLTVKDPMELGELFAHLSLMAKHRANHP